MANRRNRSGRKRKTPKDWAKDHPDDLESREKPTEDGKSVEVLTCKYCSVEIDVLTSGKKPWDRVNEHLCTKRHKLMKSNYEERMKAGKQLTLYESEVRVKTKQAEAESVVHDFTRAIIYSGLPLHQADAYIGKVLRKYCPAARTMPGARQMREKYLPEIFATHMDHIKQNIVDQKVCLILDESSDIIRRPAVNTLISFYNSSTKNKCVFLVDTSLMKSCNSTTLALLQSKVLKDIDKDWDDVIGLSTDSAAYMKKLSIDVKEAYNPKLLHFNDVGHLVHVAIDVGLRSQFMNDVRKVIIKFGALFKHAAKLERLFRSLCVSNGLPEDKVCKPPAVVPTRWYSFYESALVTKSLWRHLLMFTDSPASQESEKMQGIAELLGNTQTRQLLYAKLTFLLEVLRPIHQIQKQLESTEPLLHHMYHLVCVNLQTEISKYDGSFTLGPETATVLNMLSEEDAATVKYEILEFGKCLAEKWQDTTGRNIEAEVQALWKNAVILDPFLKCSQSQDFKDYYSMFSLVSTDNLPIAEIEKEFPLYLHEPAPQNPELKILDYWNSSQVHYPYLSIAAVQLLCISTTSCDVERSFSLMHNLQQPNRSSMREDTLHMEMVMYFNKDVEGHFDNY